MTKKEQLIKMIQKSEEEVKILKGRIKKMKGRIRYISNFNQTVRKEAINKQKYYEKLINEANIKIIDLKIQNDKLAKFGKRHKNNIKINKKKIKRLDNSIWEWGTKYLIASSPKLHKDTYKLRFYDVLFHAWDMRLVYLKQKLDSLYDELEEMEEAEEK